MNSEMNANKSDPPLDTSTKLAFETNYLAHERTQLSWIQVGLAFISFGFSIAKVFEMLREKDPNQSPVLGARTVGILMISIGLGSLILANIQHWRTSQALRRKCPGLPISHAGGLAVLLALLGIAALIGAILRH